ncbi:MAG: hypothetical protein ACI8Z7_000976 [Candidatus Nanohaloarchaea archaeon]|jgi:hypothetical protein
MQNTAGLTVAEKTEKPEDVRLLEEPGETNYRLEQILHHLADENFSQPIPLETGEEKKCAPCGIYRIPFEQSEMIVEETDDFYLVDTEDRKGHPIRNMGVTKEHGTAPAVEDSVKMIDRLVDSTARQILHEYKNGDLENREFMLYGSMNSFSEHFHFVASDLYGNGEAEDLDKIHSYLRFEHDGTEYNLNMEKSKIRDSFGEYLERWAEETNMFETGQQV